MSIGPEEAGRLDKKTFDGLLHHWNRMHSPDERPVGDPDFDRLRRFREAHRIH